LFIIFFPQFEQRRKLASSLSGDQNHYQVLGVEKNATAAEIRKAYQSKAKEIHPGTT
jgi:DnaJ-class molecular chaperone